MTDYLIRADQKFLSPVRTACLGEVQTAVRLDTKPQVGDSILELWGFFLTPLLRFL